MGARDDKPDLLGPNDNKINEPGAGLGKTSKIGNSRALQQNYRFTSRMESNTARARPRQ